jgi:GST-like protein
MTPNGYKVPIMLEELGMPYEIEAVNIVAGEQKTPEFLAMNPNHKIPVLTDTEGPDGKSITLFESAAIMWYLAEKSGKLLPKEIPNKLVAMEWLMFQMASVGPMFGQAGYFIKFATEKVPFAIDRYTKEAERLCGVLETRLSQAEYMAGEYSIADIATWPWVRSGIDTGYVDLSKFTNLKRWFDAIAARPAVVAALAKTDAAVAAKKAAAAK